MTVRNESESQLTSGGLSDEAVAVLERYGRRMRSDTYGVLKPEVIYSTQEWQREMLLMFGSVCCFESADLQRLRLVDVGCGYGGHLLDFMRFGFLPQNLTGIELLPDRVAMARSRVSNVLSVHEGDAASAQIQAGSIDIAFQSVVFSSLLSDEFQQGLADRMWSWLRIGGGIMWYDFTYNNPANPDVRGVSLRRIKALFPDAKICARRVTLAPPISRRVCRIHPFAYNIFNMFPFLRTHLLCWIEKQKGN